MAKALLAFIGLTLTFSLASTIIVKDVWASTTCSNANTESDVVACLSSEVANQASALKGLVDKLNGRYRNDDRVLNLKMHSAQRAWLKFRDKNCAFKTHENQKGTGGSGYLLRCISEMNEARIRELRSVVDAP